MCVYRHTTTTTTTTTHGEVNRDLIPAPRLLRGPVRRLADWLIIRRLRHALILQRRRKRAAARLTATPSRVYTFQRYGVRSLIPRPLLAPATN